MKAQAKGVMKMSEIREKAEDVVATIRATVAQQAVAFAIATESCVDVVEGMLKLYEERGRREALLAVLRAIPGRLPQHPHSDPMEATETGCDVCEIGILIAEHLGGTGTRPLGGKMMKDFTTDAEKYVYFDELLEMVKELSCNRGHAAGCSGGLGEQYHCKCGWREMEPKVKALIEKIENGE